MLSTRNGHNNLRLNGIVAVALNHAMDSKLARIFIAVIKVLGDLIPLHLEGLLFAIRHSCVNRAQIELRARIVIARRIDSCNNRLDRSDAIPGIPSRALHDVQRNGDRPTIYASLKVVDTARDRLCNAIDHFNSRTIHIPVLVLPRHRCDLDGSIFTPKVQLARKLDIYGFTLINPAGQIQVIQNLIIIPLWLLGFNDISTRWRTGVWNQAQIRGIGRNALRRIGCAVHNRRILAFSVMPLISSDNSLIRRRRNPASLVNRC